jgi:hypothetical protein
MKSPLHKLCFLLLTGVGLSSCAPVSRESCINDSGYDIGYSAAMDNADRATRLRAVNKICGKQGREVGLAEFNAGFEAGTAAFCVPDNGFRWGKMGRSYNGVCASEDFGAAYEDGLRIHKIEQRRKAITDRLDQIRFRLSGITKMLDEDKTLTPERRRALVREEDQLLLERRDLLAEQSSLPLR